MGWINQPVKIASFLLIVVGVGLLALNIAFGGRVNVALPLVFLILGGMFFILVFATRDKWAWAGVLYIPGALLLVFGLIFLINVLTNDWQAWAYAWLLLVAGLGAGLVLAGGQLPWPPVVKLIGWGMIVAGVPLFALFGAIPGGLFIQVMAPILIILGGLALRWLRPEAIFPESILERLHLAKKPGALTKRSPEQGGLVEPLSIREIEVLQLVIVGLSNQQIAADLNIAASTVKTHINNIYGKLGVQTRVQAINRARELGLIDPEG